ncbi:pre-mRNA-splicing factor CWC25 homolog isoform X2 [Halyomorpha halys]|nr:pre-mRNA-splicing factor CWC25 homolog isoform X2 [Halyomorpha halys]
MEGPKLEWMYKDSNDVVDREEYLLGRPIDKAFEQSSFSNEIEKDCLPTSIFANAGSTVQVDVIRKLKEDPLEIIRQQEIDRRKQLLKNPVKLKKLQNMLKTKENNVSIKHSKSSEKKKTSDPDSNDIDKLLASKYLKIMKKHGIKSLSELSNVKIEKKHKVSKKHRRSISDSSSSSSSETESDEEDYRKHKEESRKRHDHKNSSSSSKDHNKKELYSHKKGNSYRDKEPDKYINERNKDRGDKKSPTQTTSEKNYRTRKPDKEKMFYRTSNKRDISTVHRPRSDSTNNASKKHKNGGLSETEKQKRLNDMMQNAKWRDDVRSQNIARYKKEESSEKLENYSEDFMR